MNLNAPAVIFDPEEPNVLIEGKSSDLPQNLYIPPDALRVVLDNFSGPLDLLLYLIRRQNLDILNIPVAKITKQYMQYVEMMQAVNLELASEYLLMAAILAEIKSRMLLPRQTSTEEEEEEDPRAELIRRLQEYERFKKAADNLDALPRLHRDTFTVNAAPPEKNAQPLPDIALQELLVAFAEITKRAALFDLHNISREPLSVRERMSSVLAEIQKNNRSQFSNLFSIEEGRSGVVVTLLAILELIKEQLVDIVQNNHYAEIYIQARSH